MSKFVCPKCKGEFDEPAVVKRGYNFNNDAYCPFCNQHMVGLTREINIGSF